MTNGYGVDVVIDNVGTPIFTAVRRSLAINGRWLMVGQLSDGFVSFNPAQMFLKNQSMMSVHSTSKAQLEDTLMLIAHGVVRPVISGTCQLDELPSVHRQMQAGTIVGRVVIRTGGRGHYVAD
jgi:NADPH:quinone reductase-like Zn-dependent oxidoreductase